MQKILIVDDNETMLATVNTVLSKAGYMVHAASNGKAAIEHLSTNSPDIVITDLQMPYANGLNVIDTVRAKDGGRSTGILVLSSLGDEATVTELFRHGADDYVRVPFRAVELVSRVEKLISQKGL
ncbi:MAG: response regulator transcription factor [Taibaiella sp.]|nr:response regulator transcription factor [Taibaiella sp.]